MRRGEVSDNRRDAAVIVIYGGRKVIGKVQTNKDNCYTEQRHNQFYTERIIPAPGLAGSNGSLIDIEGRLEWPIWRQRWQDYSLSGTSADWSGPMTSREQLITGITWQLIWRLEIRELLYYCKGTLSARLGNEIPVPARTQRSLYRPHQTAECKLLHSRSVTEQYSALKKRRKVTILRLAGAVLHAVMWNVPWRRKSGDACARWFELGGSLVERVSYWRQINTDVVS
ncbi:hypothetical protein J6590_005704 [Homalodisca vitripennis]|nr:hypothetical protein J6590_005704 [Homalodisca vitripennis]